MESERFFAQSAYGIRCAECRLAAPSFTRAVAYGVYENELREMVHLLKYEGVSSVATRLGGMLAAAIVDLAVTDALVVAVPLFPSKQKIRGYNQAVLLADAALKHLNGDGLQRAHGVLARVRDTESQFALTPRNRRKNLRGAFVVPDPAQVAGREVLLVDDIYTTGATARECARVLVKAGAAKVWVATLARAQKESVGFWDASVRDPVRFGDALQE
jgi:ComF family protein